MEWTLRAALVGALALALVRSLAPAAASQLSLRVATRELPAALAEATRSPWVTSLVLTVDSVPSPMHRAWLAALRHAGVDIAWSGRLTALAVQAERTREPDSRVRVAVVADSGSAIALADSAGALDSLVALPRGAALVGDLVVGMVRAARGRIVASAAVPPALTPRGVLVLGRAGWESRFVVAALQEAGWTVRSREPAAPGVAVADAGIAPVDTSRYAVVVALDSTAADMAPVVARFVRQGGGLVLAGDTPALAAFAPLAPAGTSAPQPGRLPADVDSVTRGSLPLRPLTGVRSDAVRLEGTPARAAVAVRRAGPGRVMTVGYDESWRWRMMGGAGGAAAHRDWWSRTVGMVAPEPVATLARGSDAAPVAALAEALGPARVGAITAPAPPLGGLRWYLLAVIVAALLAETASRRFRGAS